MTLATKLRHEADLLPVNTPGNKALRERLLQLADEAEPRGDTKPGQVYWNKGLASFGVVYAASGGVTKLQVVGVGRYNNRKWKRVTWKNGVPKTWRLWNG